MTVENAGEALRRTPDRAFATLFQHGTLVVEYYAPHMVDDQEPHTRDEVYVIVSGTGWFVHNDDRQPFEPGEVLFVPAGDPHRFEDFTDDFATWVLFYGPEGGEAP
jgi:quercetin dioxygenase-like cupin family protein